MKHAHIIDEVADSTSSIHHACPVDVQFVYTFTVEHDEVICAIYHSDYLIHTELY